MIDKFTQGFICAVASLVQMHDIGSMGEETLRLVGKINWSEISSTDIDWLKTGDIDLKKFGYKGEVGI